MTVAAPTRQRFPVPWGLIIALNVYGVLVTSYVWVSTWRSPEYQAAEHFTAAQQLLGLDDGRKASRAELDQAYRHLLEAGRLMPGIRLLHDRTESVRWRFEERHFKPDPELAYRAEANATLYQRIQQEQAPILVVGARDRGWAPDQLLARPTTLFLWSLPGALAIVIVWASLRFSARAVRAKDHLKDLEQLEAEVAQSERSKLRAQPRAGTKLRLPRK